MVTVALNLIISFSLAMAAPKSEAPAKGTSLAPKAAAPPQAAQTPQPPAPVLKPDHMGVINSWVPLSEMKPGQVYAVYPEPIPFSQWTNPIERTYLNLFPGFREQARFRPSQIEIKEPVMFRWQARVLINKPADAIQLGKLINLDNAAKMQERLATVKQIQSSEVNTTRDVYLYRNSPDFKWCEAQGSLCFRADFILDWPALLVVNVISIFERENKPDEENKPEMSSQSELKFQALDSSQAEQIKKLTGITDSQPTGLLVLTSFWFKHGFEFAKTIIVVQPDPSNSRRSIMTGFSVVAIEGKHWSPIARNALLGKNPLCASEGISAGLPINSEQLFTSLTKLVEN